LWDKSFPRHSAFALKAVKLATPAKPIASGKVVWRWIDIQA
jgi:hypothetical protein